MSEDRGILTLLGAYGETDQFAFAMDKVIQITFGDLVVHFKDGEVLKLVVGNRDDLIAIIEER